MVATIVIFAVTIALMVLALIFKPSIQIKRYTLQLYWPIALVGALVLTLSWVLPPDELWSGLIADSTVNPGKILVLFLSMAILSIVLDELGFFAFLASWALRHAGKSQLRLFFILYLFVSVLTVFTSNDIVILTFTPFIICFCKDAKINPLPYLFAEFVGANSWSQILLIGNVTNIYLAESAGISFFDYFKAMWLPSTLSSLVGLGMTLLIFGRKLTAPIDGGLEPIRPVKDKVSLGFALASLGGCIIALSISNYIRMEMYLLAFGFMVFDLLSLLIVGLVRKDLALFPRTAKRIPYDVVPFVLSMFAFVLALTKYGVSANIASWLNGEPMILKYGLASFFTCDLINNIPMSVLFSAIASSGGYNSGAVYAAISGSNLGALLTPIGALAGIMWLSILHKDGIKMSFGKFVLYGAPIAIASMLTAIGGLYLSLAYLV
ncbi:MAG: Arsenical pump membrane protein [Tenericutes bacterium ADurb.BinA155]|jgi:arsenical pump membrane protein|nr:MAG: Arsenical pump membrane protein [Tenericutes bacterium ADurb.BinA155]